VANRPQRVVVYRDGDHVRCELLQPLQFEWLEALLRGDALGQACAALAESVAEETPPVGEWLGRWIRQGLVVRCD